MEDAAKLIFEAMWFSSGADAPPWDEPGHGEMKDEARTIANKISVTPPPSPNVVAYPIDDEDLRCWRVWWHGSGPQRGDHIMLASRYDLGYEREIAYLGDQHHEAASALVHLHNITVDKLRAAAPTSATNAQVAPTALKQEPLHGKATDAEWLRDLANRIRNVPVMYGLNGFDIDCLGDMAKRMKAGTNA